MFLLEREYYVLLNVYRTAAPKKKSSENLFDVFGLFPEESKSFTKSGESDLLESSIVNRIPNGVTKRARSLDGNFFVELKVYHTADIRGELRQDRWKKAVLAVKAQIDDDTDEWQSLQKFIKKLKILFEGVDVKFYTRSTE